MQDRSEKEKSQKTIGSVRRPGRKPRPEALPPAYPPVVALDVGTTKIACLIGELGEDGRLARVAGIGNVPAMGMHKGVVVDLPGASAAIAAAADAAAETAGVEITGAYVGVAGSHIVSMNRRVFLTNPNPDGRVTQAERKDLLNKLKNVEVSPDLKLIHALPRQYVLDGQDGIKRPVGLWASQIEMDGHLVFGAINSIQNLVAAVEKAGLTVKDIMLEPLASSQACLSEQELESGVMLVDIGGGTTDVAMFSGGRLVHSAVLPVGGNHFTKDISVGLKVPLPAAEEIKLKFGHAQSHVVEDIEMVKTTVSVAGAPGDRTVTFSKKFLARIIEARMAEIFSLVLRQAQESGYLSSIAAGIVVTGGSSQLEGTCGLASQVTGFPCRCGLPTAVADVIDIPVNPVYATAVGLLLYGSGRINARGPSQPAEPSIATLGLWEEVLAKVKGWFGRRNKT
ncbi:MAG: cell division protein FtsA [Actinobacteria bacterium]|nr:cell division protein FtsA [Actinomycetota bacterium]